jgi:dihydroorotase
MPNLNPVPDSLENLNLQRAIIEKDACIHVYPYGAITVGEKGEELADIEGMAPYVCGFSDDGRGVQKDEMMRAAMEDLGRQLVAKQDKTSQTVVEAVGSLKSRMYR